MSVSIIFFYLCLSFIAGIFLSSIITISQLFLLSFLIFALVLISVLWKYKKIAVAGFCILFLVAGVWRHQMAELRIKNDELRKYNDSDKDIILVGVVDKEPVIKDKNINLKIRTESLGGKSIRGKVLIITNRYPEYQYGNKLKITGELKTPQEDIDGFNYKNYLKKDGIYSVMDWPKIELAGSGFGNPIKSILFSFKKKFQESAQNFIPPPQAGILEALFSGDESRISKDWKEKLNITGTRHITAVSGMNITIIGFLILAFALNLGLWRQQAFYLSIFLLILYILMIGAPASAVRAGIMAGFLMLAQYFGRLSSAPRAIVFAGFFMLLFNPLLLKLDVGFQLSFLAILGLVYFQPWFFNRLKKIPNPKFFLARTTLSATLAAQIFVLPILIYNFGQFSLVSPATNLLIVPILAPLTILIFAFGVSAMIFKPIGFLLFLPTWFFLTYITSLIDWFSRIPYSFFRVENLHWFWLILSYLVLCFWAFWLRKRERLKFLNY